MKVVEHVCASRRTEEFHIVPSIIDAHRDGAFNRQGSTCNRHQVSVAGVADGGAVNQNIVYVQGATRNQACSGDGARAYADRSTSKATRGGEDTRDS